MKLKHDADTLFTAIGMDEETFKRMVGDAADAFDDKDKNKSEAIAAAVKSMRRELLDHDDGSDPSQYEMAIGIVMMRIGSALEERAIRQKVRSVTSIIAVMQKTGAPEELITMMMAKALNDLARGPEGADGHECSKCGECGKTFDDEGKQTDNGEDAAG